MYATFAPAAYFSFIPDQNNCMLTMDISNLVRTWVNGTYANYGLMLYSTGPNHIISYVSKENGTANELPKLDIVYTVPATNTPTFTPSPTNTFTPPYAPTNTSTFTPSATLTPSPTNTFTPIPTFTYTPAFTPTLTPVPIATSTLPAYYHFR
ncbi:MAG: DNRLRE domain-containing protein [Chloroflexota bacterium]